MKLIVQIPCYNEAGTLAEVVRDIPRRVEGFERVEVLVVDDGSRDGTAELARALGVDHVVCHCGNRGLARTFATGLDSALRLGADVIVNTDGDNQYCGADIPKLVAPILRGEAELVIGDRQTWNVPHFSLFKRLLQRIGSRVVRRLAATDVPDAVSGFRAMTRDAAFRINVVTSFSYTIETLIQAGRSRVAIRSVPIRTNPATRPSRLFRSVPQFVARSASTMMRAYAMHRPLTVFFVIGLALLTAGAVPILRFITLYLAGAGDGHIQSLVLGGALVVLGGVAWAFGMLADLIAANRRLLEMTLSKVRRMEAAAPPDRGPASVAGPPHCEASPVPGERPAPIAAPAVPAPPSGPTVPWV